MAVIGFMPDAYSVVENEGGLNFMFGVLSGELGFVLDIEFFLENGTAIEGTIVLSNILVLM